MITLYRMIIDIETKHPSLEEIRSYEYKQTRFQTPDSIVRMMNKVFNLYRQSDEFIYMAGFSSKMQLIGVFEVAHGTVNRCMVDTRGVYLRALLIGAVNIVLIHNHPSGDSEPSSEDLEITKKMKQAGDLIGINLSDHIIIGDREYYSMKKMDILD